MKKHFKQFFVIKDTIIECKNKITVISYIGNNEDFVTKVLFLNM